MRIRPWKIRWLKFPNDRVMAGKQAHCLKRKFQKEKQFFSHYKDFMNEIIERGYAKVLIKNVKAICASGGFKLTKFWTNCKQVLQSIDEAVRRQGAKDKDFMGDLPAERALRSAVRYKGN